MAEDFYKRIYFYCDADEEGNIINPIAGLALVPTEQRQYFFILDNWDIVDNVDDYKVEDGGLGLKKKIIKKENAEE